MAGINSSPRLKRYGRRRANISNGVMKTHGQQERLYNVPCLLDAKKEKEQADQNDKEGAPQEEAGEKNIQDNENNHAQDAEDGKKESPIQIVLQLKQNALLGMTVSDM